MVKILKTALFWLIACIITVSAAVYQRLTGPTHPERIEYEISDNQYKSELIRSEEGEKDARVALEISDEEVYGFIHYKRFNVEEEWMKDNMVRENGELVGYLPNQPPAGKLEYYIELKKGDDRLIIPHDNTVVIRFKGEVPKSFLLPHILFMFAAMLVANFTAILALAKNPKFKLYSIITLILMGIGGMILGPIIQWYAFGDLWTGVPFGFDLTDNKTLIAFLFWIFAVIMNRKTDKPTWSLIAALVTLVIFSIPHSVMGSELNYETGEVMTGMISILF